jgi:hypothetical protein
MTRDASGTSWQPDASPHDGIMVHTDSGWMLMGHALFNGVYDSQGGPRGGDKTFLAGMVMGMAQRRSATGTLGFKAMLSPDPFMGKSGYPLLLATGETADGEPRWSTASTRTTSSWSCRPATAIRWAAASTAISMPACRASRRSARRPSCTARRPWTVPRPRSPTTGSTRPTSPSAW